MAKYMMPIQSEWMVWDTKQLSEMDKDDADSLMALYDDFNSNRIKYFLGHGGGIPFINDRENDFCLLTAGNRRGKSYAGAAWLIVRTIPMDPSWPCFTENGLDYHEWEGPRKVVACSYSLKDHIRPVILPLLLEMLPDDELGEYSPRYRGKGRKKVNFAGEPILPLKCGSEIHFKAYMQDAVSFESDRYDYGWLDEQPPQQKIDGLIERGRTGLERTQYASTMTPHAVKSWPESGAAGPLMKAAKGQIDLGVSLGTYNINTEDVPDQIFPDSEKKKAYQRWVEGPKKTGNMKDMREGQARYYGIPQSSEGLAIDTFDREIHVIEPFPIPSDWTLYRGQDYGGKNPHACVWGAVSPDGIVFIYREYYQAGRQIPEHCETIVEMSGNKRVRIDMVTEAGGIQRPIYDEEFIKEDYAASVLDGRSFGTKNDGVNTIGQQMNEWGCYCTKASGKQDKFTVPMVNSYFMVHDDLTHPFTKEKGSPRIFIFEDCTSLISNIEGLVHKDSAINQNENEDVRKHEDHAYDAMKYLLATDPQYLGDNYMDPYDEFQEQRDNRGSSFTGY